MIFKQNLYVPLNEPFMQSQCIHSGRVFLLVSHNYDFLLKKVVKMASFFFENNAFWLNAYFTSFHCISVVFKLRQGASITHFVGLSVRPKNVTKVL